MCKRPARSTAQCPSSAAEQRRRCGAVPCWQSVAMAHTTQRGTHSNTLNACGLATRHHTPRTAKGAQNTQRVRGGAQHIAVSIACTGAKRPPGTTHVHPWWGRWRALPGCRRGQTGTCTIGVQHQRGHTRALKQRGIRHPRRQHSPQIPGHDRRQGRLRQNTHAGKRQGACTTIRSRTSPDPRRPGRVEAVPSRS